MKWRSSITSNTIRTRCSDGKSKKQWMSRLSRMNPGSFHPEGGSRIHASKCENTGFTPFTSWEGLSNLN
jgi:hypothetical protein